MNVESARIVQLSDTHFSAAAGTPPQWRATVEWLHRHPPDLVVHTGDIVCEDPDDERDRAFARHLLDQLPVSPMCIPGNHDVGFYGEDDRRRDRLRTFRETWGDDRFSLDLAGWRVIGVDAYLLGTTEHDAWVHEATRTSSPVLAFVHQPMTGDPADGWEMPGAARAAFQCAVEDADVRVVASGHRHRSGQLGRAVWAPSLTLVGDAQPGFDPRCGVLEHRLQPGSHTWQVVRPWDLSPPAGRSA